MNMMAGQLNKPEIHGTKRYLHGQKGILFLPLSFAILAIDCIPEINYDFLLKYDRDKPGRKILTYWKMNIINYIMYKIFDEDGNRNY